MRKILRDAAYCQYPAYTGRHETAIATLAGLSSTRIAASSPAWRSASDGFEYALAGPEGRFGRGLSRPAEDGAGRRDRVALGYLESRPGTAHLCRDEQRPGTAGRVEGRHFQPARNPRLFPEGVREADCEPGGNAAGWARFASAGSRQIGGIGGGGQAGGTVHMLRMVKFNS